MHVRPLPKELQDKAIKELNENPKRIRDDLKHIKDWLTKQSHINARTEDQWLISFLRGCKFSLERTKKKLDMFYTMRSIIPEFYSDYDPFTPEVQEALRLGIILPLGKVPGSDTPLVIILRVGVCDPTKFKLETLFKATMMIIDILMNESDQFVVSGFTAILDMKGVTMTHLLNTSPAVLKKVVTCFQDAYPIRTKSMHFHNIPSFFERIYILFKPFLNKKILQRVIVHNSNKMDEVYKVIPKSILPNEYGGDAGQVGDFIDYWKDKVESYRNWFREEEEAYGTYEFKRRGKPRTSAELFGIEGSFRKLDFD